MRPLLLALLSTALLAAAVPDRGPGPGRFLVRSYGLEQGLDSLPVQCLAQDERGFLWVGTDAGLYRFDGDRFERFGPAEGLPSAAVNHVLTVRGEVYVGTVGGLARLEGVRFVPVPGAPSTAVLGLAGDASGRIWLADAQGLYFREAGRDFTQASGWPGGPCHAVFASADGAQVLASQGPVLLERDGAGWRRWGREAGLDRERIDRVVIDGQGRVWARSPRHLWMRPPGGARFLDQSAALLGKSSVGHLGLDRNGRVWLPTDSGLHYLDGDRWQPFGPRQGLPTSWARAVLQDREGSLWIGSMGVHRILGRGAWMGFGEREGLPSDVIWCVQQAADGRLWIGTDKGLSWARPGGWETVPGTARQAVRSLVEAEDGSLWFTGAPVDLLRWDPQRRSLRTFGAESGLRGSRVNRLFRDRQGRWWAATVDAGLFRGELRGGVPSFTPEALPDGHPGERVNWITEDREHRLWVLGERGLAVLDQGRWRRYGTADGLRARHVSYAILSTGGYMILAYFEPAGILRARIAAGGRLEILGHQPVGPAERPAKVYALGEDRKGRLWVGTGTGVDLFGPGERTEHIGTSDGLISEDCDAMAFLADAQGNVWVGTSGGLARYRADEELGALGAPEPVVTEVRMAGQVQAFPTAGGTLVFRPRLGGLDLRYATLSFASEHRREFRVHIQGLGDQPRVTRQRELHIPSLPKGRYRLEIQTRVPPADWGSSFALWIEVPPAWWQTWWARALGLAALAAAVVAVVRWRVRHLRAANRRLEDLIQARTHELQEANATLRALSLTDPLTGMRNRRFLHMVLPEDVAQVLRAFEGRDREGRVGAENLGLLFLMVDLDHFKSINDTFGHHAGDEVLMQMQPILAGCIRDSDLVVRWGGEEFLVVARHADQREAGLLAERIRKAVAQHAFDIGADRPLRPTCSIGCAPFPFLPWAHQALKWEQAVDLADACLYAAKRAGRNTWVALLAEPSLQAADLPAEPSLAIPAWLAAGKVTALSSHGMLAPAVWEQPRSGNAPA